LHLFRLERAAEHSGQVSAEQGDAVRIFRSSGCRRVDPFGEGCPNAGGHRLGALMPEFLKSYVRGVEKVSRLVGRAAMYLIFVLMAILLYSSISKAFLLPAQWTLEMAQFTMVAYYILGGPYSMQQDEHVRMDLGSGLITRR
jgi:hypothetical protein